jgi:peptidoglycan/LPS O-acetylase OafA/YrhL
MQLQSLSHSSRPLRNEGIEGLRGVAATMVLLYHLHCMSAKAGFINQSNSPWLENLGIYAVLLFFCISGYLIVGSLSRHRDLRRFAVNRVLRIYPLFLILHLIMFGLGPWMNYEWMGSLRDSPSAYAGHFLSNLFFLPGLTQLPIAQKNAWSLSYETAFYIIAVALAYAGRRWSLPMPLKMMGFLLVCLAIGLHDALFVFFMLGALVFWLDSKGYLPMLEIPALGIISGIAGLCLYSLGGAWAALPAVLLVFIEVVRQKGWLARLLSSRACLWLGKISFSLYLVHPFVLDLLRRLLMKISLGWPEGLSNLMFCCVGTFLAIAGAKLSHEMIEMRLTHFLKKHSRLARRPT